MLRVVLELHCLNYIAVQTAVNVLDVAEQLG